MTRRRGRAVFLRVGLITLSVAAGAQVGGSVLLDLNVSSLAPFSGSACRSRSGDGGLIVSNAATDGACNFNPDTKFVATADYRFEATLRLRQGSQTLGYGITIGDREDSRRVTRVAIALSQSGIAVVKWLDAGAWNELPGVKPAPAPRTTPGSSNHLVLEVRGREVRGLLNDQLIAAGTPPVPVDGRIGVLLDSSDQEVVVTEFKVTALPPRTTTALGTANSGVPGGGDFKFTAGGATYLEDDLSTNERLSLLPGSVCAIAYAQGGLQVSGAAGCEFELESLDPVVMRARFELSGRVIKGDTLGLIVGRSKRPDELHYHLDISTDGKFALQMIQNKTPRALIPWMASSAVRTGPGMMNRLAVEVLGQELRCFINGQYVGRATSTDVVQGGVWVSITGASSSAVFTNVKIVDLNAGGGTAREAATGGLKASTTRSPAGPAEVRSRESRVPRTR